MEDMMHTRLHTPRFLPRLFLNVLLLGLNTHTHASYPPLQEPETPPVAQEAIAANPAASRNTTALIKAAQHTQHAIDQHITLSFAPALFSPSEKQQYDLFMFALQAERARTDGLIMLLQRSIAPTTADAEMNAFLLPVMANTHKELEALLSSLKNTFIKVHIITQMAATANITPVRLNTHQHQYTILQVYQDLLERYSAITSNASIGTMPDNKALTTAIIKSLPIGPSSWRTVRWFSGSAQQAYAMVSQDLYATDECTALVDRYLTCLGLYHHLAINGQADDIVKLVQSLKVLQHDLIISYNATIKDEPLSAVKRLFAHTTQLLIDGLQERVLTHNLITTYGAATGTLYQEHKALTTDQSFILWRQQQTGQDAELINDYLMAMEQFFKNPATAPVTLPALITRLNIRTTLYLTGMIKNTVGVAIMACCSLLYAKDLVVKKNVSHSMYGMMRTQLQQASVIAANNQPSRDLLQAYIPNADLREVAKQALLIASPVLIRKLITLFQPTLDAGLNNDVSTVLAGTNDNTLLAFVDKHPEIFAQLQKQDPELTMLLTAQIKRMATQQTAQVVAA